MYLKSKCLAPALVATEEVKNVKKGYRNKLDRRTPYNN